MKKILQISFGAGGNYKLWAGAGWYHDESEPNHTWAGHLANLIVPIENKYTTLEIDLDLMPLNHESITQQMQIFIDGIFVDFLRIDHSGSYKVFYEPYEMSRSLIKIDLVMPMAVIPTNYTNTKDERLLSLAFRNISISIPNL